MAEEVKEKRKRRTPAQMAAARKELEAAAKPELYKCSDTNRMRLYLIKNDNQLKGCSIEALRFDNHNFQTRKFAGCKVWRNMFENCNFQGSNWTDVIDCTGNTFINCELQYGTYPKGFFDNNYTVNCRLK